jgi:dienelactone hydrolase
MIVSLQNQPTMVRRHPPRLPQYAARLRDPQSVESLMKIISLALLAVAVAVTPAKSEEFKEEPTFLRIDIGGHMFRLEALMVKRTDAAGRLPIAVITHGTPGDAQSMLDTHAAKLLGHARDLASRGWLAVALIRRGFGQSDGPMPARVTCQSKSWIARFSADADDLQAALNSVSKRPDADANRMIAIGVSTGGVAVVALSARNPKGLLGAINVSGGMHFTTNCPREALLVEAFKTFGTTSRVPTLWMYARNDSFYGPDLIERLRTAFADGGGDAKLVMFDPLGQEGHNLFSMGDGRYKWLPEMDAFLRFHQLPTWRREDVDALIKRVGAAERNRKFLESFVAAPLEKALAQAASGPFFSAAWAAATMPLARERALKACGTAKPEQQCVIVMENDRGIEPAQ